MTTSQTEDGPSIAQMEAGAQALLECGIGGDETKESRMATADSVYRAMQEAGAPQVREARPAGDSLPGSTLVIMSNDIEVMSVSGPTVGAWQSLASFGRAQYMTAEQQQAAARFEAALLSGKRPAGDAAMPVLAYRVDWHESAGVLLPKFFCPDDREHMDNLLRSFYAKDKYDSVVHMVDLIDAQAALEAAELRAANAEQDLISRKNQDHATAARWDEHMRAHAEALAAKDERIGDAENRIETDGRIIAGLEADLVEERNRIASMRTEWAAEVAALTKEADKLRDERSSFQTQFWETLRQLGIANSQARHAEDCLEAAKARIAELEAKLNTPELQDFAAGVVMEAAHQRERWGSSHDVGKEPQDWFWLLGYLSGKALKAHASGDTEKALHHCISSAAVLANWHAAISGSYTLFRPGIDPVARGIEPAELSIDAANLAPAAETFMHAVPDKMSLANALRSHHRISTPRRYPNPGDIVEVDGVIGICTEYHKGWCYVRQLDDDAPWLDFISDESRHGLCGKVWRIRDDLASGALQWDAPQDATALVAAEREECAKVCDWHVTGLPSFFDIDERIKRCAEQIRARSLDDDAAMCDAPAPHAPQPERRPDAADLLVDHMSVVESFAEEFSYYRECGEGKSEMEALRLQVEASAKRMLGIAS